MTEKVASPPKDRAKRQRLRAVLQLHNRTRGVLERAEVSANMDRLTDVTITMGVQLTEEGQGNQSEGLNSAASSAETVPVNNVEGQRGSLNVVQFLSSDEGERAFRSWSSGILSSERGQIPIWASNTGGL